MLDQLLLNGVVGPMYIGQSKAELLTVLGPPPMWDGKPGTFLDKQVSNYEKSLSWIYNGIYVHFENETISRFDIWMQYPIDFAHPWFNGWNLPQAPKLSHAIEYLDHFRIPFAVTPIKPGGFGCNLVTLHSFIEGEPRRDPKVAEIDLCGISRFKDSCHIARIFGPLFDINSLMP